MTHSEAAAERSTQARLIEAARLLFYERGYNATALQDVLQAARANSGSLYHFFKTKEDLLLAVLDRYVDLLMPAVMEPAFAQATDPIERVFAVLERYRQGMIATGFSKGCPIGNLALELSDSKPTVRDKIALNFSNWCKAIQRCLDDASGRLPAGLDRQRLARFVLTVMEGGIMQTRAHRSIQPFDEAVASLRDYFDRLLEEAPKSERDHRERSDT